MNFLSQLEEFKRELDVKHEFALDIHKIFSGSDKSVVDIRKQNLTPNQLIEVFDSIRNDRSVKKLVLSGNKINSQVALYLAILLLENQYIKILDVSSCGLTDEGLNVIMSALGCRKAPIGQLALHDNDISTKLQEDALSLVKNPSSAERSPTLKPVRNIICELVARNISLRDMLNQFSKQADKKSEGDKKKTKGQLKHKKVTVDVDNFQVKNMKVRATTSESPFSIFLCNVDGWQCCMKEMSLEGMPEADIRDFLGEIELLENIPHHKNIVKYMFHQRTVNTIRLFVSWYRMSLREVISYRRSRVLSGQGTYFHPRSIAEMAFHIASGLEFLQKYNIIHRDLKPDNILCNLDADNCIFNLAITDFHSAKRITKKTQAKTVVGTPSYMSPEVLSSDNVVSYTKKVDIWGMGMVLYELITLMVPYEDEDFSNVRSLILTGKQPSTHHISAVYKPLMEIFMECSKLDPNQRPEIGRVREMLLQAINDYDVEVYAV